MFNNFKDLVDYATGLVTLATPVVGGLALLVFLKGLAGFISKAGDTESHKEGRNLMIWGLLALFIMVSFLSIITLAKKEAGTNTRTGIPLITPNK